MSRPAIKGDFVRSLPKDITYEDAVKRVKEAGLGTLHRSYFASARTGRHARSKVRTNGHSNGNGHATTTPSAPPPPTLPVLTSEQQFRKLVIAIGTERARKLLRDFDTLSWQ